MYIYGSRPWGPGSAGLPPEVVAWGPGVHAGAPGRVVQADRHHAGRPLFPPFSPTPPFPPFLPRCLRAGQARDGLGGRVMPSGGKGGQAGAPVPPVLPPARLAPGLRATGSGRGWLRWRPVPAPCVVAVLWPPAGGSPASVPAPWCAIRRIYFNVGFADGSPGSGSAGHSPAPPLPALLLSLTYSAIA